MEQPVAIEEQQFAPAYRRIQRSMLVAGLLMVAFGAWRFGVWFGLGTLAGCAVSLLNFKWLKLIVEVVSDAVATTGKPKGAGRVVLRFLLRYVFLALGAYVIFRSSEYAAYGFFVGLGLPVLGILAEAVYELV